MQMLLSVVKTLQIYNFYIAGKINPLIKRMMSKSAEKELSCLKKRGGYVVFLFMFLEEKMTCFVCAPFF